MEDKIKFEIAKRKEGIRRNRLLSQKRLEQQENSSVDNQLFCSKDEGDSASHKRPREEDENDQSGNHDSSTPNQADDRNQPSTKRRRRNRISLQEKRDSIKVGLELVLARVKKATTVQRGWRPTMNAYRGSLKSRRPNQPRKTNIGDSEQGRAQPGRRKKSKANQLSLQTLFSSDISREAHESSSRPAIPGFTEQNKEKALRELIASIPAADQDEAKSDKNAVIQASRKFKNRVRSDRKGGWKVKGLKTSLYHHQVRFLLFTLTVVG